MGRWVEQERELTDSDVVLRHTLGTSHLPRPQGWPIMPCQYFGFTPGPVGFLGRIPTPRRAAARAQRRPLPAVPRRGALAAVAIASTTVTTSLLVVHVDVQVATGQVDAFLGATEQNAAASRREPGILRFDVLADRADPAHVVLVEVYRDAAAAAAHKETEHYRRWRDAVAPMMARPRSSVQYLNVSPADEDW